MNLPPRTPAELQTWQAYFDLADGRLRIIEALARAGSRATIGAVMPAVTTTVQSTYLTGKWPSEHGIDA